MYISLDPEQEYAQIRKAPSRGEDRTGEAQYANVGGNVDKNQNQVSLLIPIISLLITLVTKFGNFVHHHGSYL